MPHEEVWHAIKYNVWLGVTTGALLLRMLRNPLKVLGQIVRDEPQPRSGIWIGPLGFR